MDVSDFFIFSARGRGRGSPRRQEGEAVGFLLKSQEGGGLARGERVASGREGVCRNLGGAGVNFFFWARNSRQESQTVIFSNYFGSNFRTHGIADSCSVSCSSQGFS